MPNYHPFMYFAAQVMMNRHLELTDERTPCEHCGDLMNEEPDGTKHCNTKGCRGFRPDLWPEGSVGRKEDNV